jgi:hypothetical protein
MVSLALARSAAEASAIIDDWTKTRTELQCDGVMQTTALEVARCNLKRDDRFIPAYTIALALLSLLALAAVRAPWWLKVGFVFASAGAGSCDWAENRLPRRRRHTGVRPGRAASPSLRPRRSRLLGVVDQ